MEANIRVSDDRKVSTHGQTEAACFAKLILIDKMKFIIAFGTNIFKHLQLQWPKTFLYQTVLVYVIDIIEYVTIFYTWRPKHKHRHTYIYIYRPFLKLKLTNLELYLHKFVIERTLGLVDTKGVNFNSRLSMYEIYEWFQVRKMLLYQSWLLVRFLADAMEANDESRPHSTTLFIKMLE